MKSFIIGLSLLISTNLFANLILPSCYNSSSDRNAVSLSYQSCVNNSFRTIERAIDGDHFFQYCTNVGNKVSYFFLSCVRNNFRTVEQALSDRNLFLQGCSSSRQDTLSLSFTYCVNSNWRSIERTVAD